MKSAFFILLSFIPLIFLAQQNDFQAWYSLASDVKIGDKWTVSASNEIRTSCNAQVFEKNLFDIGAEFEIRKKFDAGLFLRYSTEYPTLLDRTSKIEYYGTLQYGKKIDRLQLSARFRTGTDEDNNYLDGMEWEHRERLKLNYNLKGFPLNPALSAEVFFPVAHNFLDLSKTRILCGFTWKPDKENSHNFSLMYGWQHNFRSRVPQNDFLLCLEYKFTFRQFQKDKK